MVSGVCLKYGMLTWKQDGDGNEYGNEDEVESTILRVDKQESNRAPK